MNGNREYRRSSGNIMLRLAAVLFCLVMVSFYMMGGLFARYVSKGSGSDSARVAKFNVSAEATGDVTVTCGVNEGSGEYTITVDNESEVAIRYDIKLAFDEALFDGVTLVIVDKKGVVSGDKMTVTFENAGQLAPNSKASHTLTFSVTNWSAITKEMTDMEGTEELKFTAYVDAVQVD